MGSSSLLCLCFFLISSQESEAPDTEQFVDPPPPKKEKKKSKYLINNFKSSDAIQIFKNVTWYALLYIIQMPDWVKGGIIIEVENKEIYDTVGEKRKFPSKEAFYQDKRRKKRKKRKNC